MEAWVVITVSVIIASCVLAIVLQWFRAFYKTPIQATIRALVGLLAILVGALGIPAVEGKATLSLDWGALLAVDGQQFSVTTGPDLAHHAFAWSSVTLLLTVCLVRVPSTSPVNEQTGETS